MGTHHHENYGYGKTSEGDYFCLQCGDQVKASYSIGDMKITRHLCVDASWPLRGKDCEHSDPY